MQAFDTSLSIGKQRESELIEFFQSKGHKPVAIPGKFTGFDFFLANTKEAYEVKQDWKAHYSDNPARDQKKKTEYKYSCKPR